jgi:hypothetical protein
VFNPLLLLLEGVESGVFLILGETGSEDCDRDRRLKGSFVTVWKLPKESKLQQLVLLRWMKELT